MSLYQHKKEKALQITDNHSLTFFVSNCRGYMEFIGEKSDGTKVVAVFDVSEHTPSEAYEIFKLNLHS